MSILVMALNPSVDVEWQVDTVRWEEKNNVCAERRWPGGKGVNVARWLKLFGAKPTLLIPLGGVTGREMADGLRRERISTQVIPLREATRANVIVSTSSQGQLRFNPMGPVIATREWKLILKEAERSFPKIKALVLSGSLPRGLPSTTYAQLINAAHRHGLRTFLDCDGAPFTDAIQARPFLVKPNEHELAQWFGRSLKSTRVLTNAAQALSRTTGGWVLVSLGGKGGLLLNEIEKSFISLPAPKVKVLNTVGAGDALLAAAVWQTVKGSPPEEWLHAGIAAGSAAVQCVAGALPRRGKRI